ncbi:hypothetical protein [Paraburkholderia sp. RL17-337-BIB-A]|uniref:hypothetical protein n=1 Tax=Paraburkholderia sp. RL17-337-BIB-A TaxID=3031636 RepID=UPI0038BB85FB
MSAQYPWMTPADIEASAIAYAGDPAFRNWLGAVARFRDKRLRDIEQHSVRLMAESPGKQLRERVDRFMRSYEVQWWHLHSEWMRKGGALKGVEMIARRATFFELWKAANEGCPLPWELDPGKACSEGFARHEMPKRGGRGSRRCFSFGVAGRTRQKIVDAALKAAGCGLCRAQFIYAEGGRLEAIDEIARAINANPMLSHYAKLDLANCFDNIDLARAHEFLPVRRKVVQHTIGIDRREASGRRNHGRVLYPTSTVASALHRTSSDDAESVSILSPDKVLDHLAIRYPLLLPQGAACSPRVAYWLIEKGLPPLDPARAFMYGDDLFLLGQSEREVRAEASWFGTLFSTHAAGPLPVGRVEIGATAGGAGFLGIEIIHEQVSPPLPGLRVSAVALSVNEESRRRFMENARELISRGVAYGDESLSEARVLIQGFLNAAPRQDRISLFLEVLQIANDSEADLNVLYGGIDMH